MTGSLVAIRKSTVAAYRRPGKPSGFTLVELLVVITIIGILVGLMLPAVFAAMNAARRAQCLNNVKQLALSMMTFESAQKSFPQNWGVTSTIGKPTASGGKNSIGQSWMTQILPNIDENNLYQVIVFKKADGKYATFSENQQVAITTIKSFICPADTSYGKVKPAYIDSNTEYGATNYKAVAGSNWQGNSTFKTRKLDRYNPITAKTGFGGRNRDQYEGLDKGDGVICRGGGAAPKGKAIPTSIAYNEVKDGTSNTFLVGETIPQFCNWTAWFSYDGTIGTCAITLNYWRTLKPPTLTATDWGTNMGFMSRHSGGANFGRCDGSAGFVSDSIDSEVYRAMATIDGGEAKVKSTSTSDILDVKAD
jgi:prepilin-type N-terminal cleavage/methylation domain-containing protein/prepilin-type processing-associated H-X9-DG protein